MSSKATAAKQRNIQQQVEKADEKAKSKPTGAMQAGARHYPGPPFPKVHQDKPSSEADLPLAPRRPLVRHFLGAALPTSVSDELSDPSLTTGAMESVPSGMARLNCVCPTFRRRQVGNRSLKNLALALSLQT
ncbi:hypothetical protein GCM10010520_11190 [Rhizobium viscosum]|uniref:Uncharacterized protein n=1 Tax=Rhizobium viscosum TaxID=1673 RepID=A0ABR9IYN8_RHIVS|nr:hypothetical protein [Rhizobium viscosum]